MKFIHRIFRPNVEKMYSAGDIEGLINCLDYNKHGVWKKTRAYVVELGRTHIDALINALTVGSDDIRYEVVLALYDIADDRAANALIERLADTNISIRRLAIQALGKIGNPRAVEPIRALLNDDAPDVRATSAEALGRFEDPGSVPALLAAMHDEDKGVYKHTLLALAGIGDQRAADPLIAALLTDLNWEDRQKVVEALGRMGDPKAIQVLMPHLSGICRRVDPRTDQASDDFYPGLADSAVQAMGRIGKAALDPILNMISDLYRRSGGFKDDPHFRDERHLAPCRFLMGAVQALGIIGDRKALPALNRVLSSDHEELRNKTVQALGRIGEPESVEAIMKYAPRSLETPFALGKIKSTGAMRALIRILESEHIRFGLRSDVVNIIVEFGPRAVGSLLVLLKNAEEHNRQAAAEALGRIKSAEAVEGLISALDDAQHSVQEAAAVALGRIGDVKAVDALMGKLSDSAFGGKTGAIEALGRIGDERVLELVFRQLGDRIPNVRMKAVEALGRMGGPRVLSHLLASLKDEFPGVRKVALEALSASKDACLVEPVSRLLEEEYNQARWRSQEITDPQSLESYRPILSAAEAVVINATALLGAIGDASAAGVLVQALSYDIINFEDIGKVYKNSPIPFRDMSLLKDAVKSAERALVQLGRPAIGALKKEIDANTNYLATQRAERVLQRIEAAGPPEALFSSQ
jgi:HEAT repeat protein